MENKEDEKVICCYCGEEGIKEDFEDFNGELICEDCYKKARICENCGKTVFVDDDKVVCVDGSFFCDENCANGRGYKKCHDCGRYEKESNMYYFEGYNDYICSSCYEDNYFTCDNCGEVCENNEMCIRDNGNLYLCEYCAEDYDSDHEGEDEDCFKDVGEYHCFNNWEPFLNKDEDIDTTILYGFELEIENKGNLSHSELIEGVNKILKKYDLETLFVYEHDGSISYGFEIISQPMGFNFFVENSEVFKEVLRYLDENGAKSHDTSTCGLHVHFTKKFFNSDEISRLLYLFEKFKNNLAKFSRRSTDNLNRWASFLNISQENLSLDYLKTRGEDVSRYRAVNLTNSKTIEVRIFKGTLLFDSFASSIELVKIISELAKTLNDSEVIKIERFEDIIKNSIYLEKYCKERKIIEGGV